MNEQKNEIKASAAKTKKEESEKERNRRSQLFSVKQQTQK